MSGPSITYREADWRDVEALAVLRREFLLEVADARPDDPSILPRLRSWFKEKLANGHFSAILAVLGFWSSLQKAIGTEAFRQL